MRVIAGSFSAILLLVGFWCLAQAQEGRPVGPNPPAGLFTTTGALKGNGSGTISQAACGDLSNAGTGCAAAAGAVQTTGTWTPVPTNLTVVGTPTYTGTYIKTGVNVFISLTVAATTSTASTANSTMFSGLPFTQATNAVCNAVNPNNVTSYGNGVLTGNVLYTPTWGIAPLVQVNCIYQSTS
jgi:hypothetical protein